MYFTDDTVASGEKQRRAIRFLARLRGFAAQKIIFVT
jgi:hypothetical protein